MGLFDKLFSFGTTEEEIKPDVLPVFGRYSDNNKSKFQLEEWKKAEASYKAKKYDDAIVHFFTYIRDEDINNVVFEPNDENARFHLYQGSKKITGTIDNNCVRAEVGIAKVVKTSVPVMRQLLEKNFQLYYSKFYLEENNIKLKIYNNVTAANPKKLYFALKELAIQADRLDDILVDDFIALEAEGIGHIQELTDEEKQIKYDFFRYWLDKTIAKVEKLNPNTFAGGITYSLLNLVYKLDYLLLPEGKLTEKLEEVNSAFWGVPQDTPAIKRNAGMLTKLKELQAWKEEDVKKYFYKTKHTFSLTKPTSFKLVKETINNTMKNIGWYSENDHNDIALEMMEYSFAFSQFSYSLPKPATQLFDILMHVNHCDYYMAMGYPEKLYVRSQKAFDSESIKAKIEAINEENKERYNLINIDTNALDFENLQSFNFTLLAEIVKLDLRKKK